MRENNNTFHRPPRKTKLPFVTRSQSAEKNPFLFPTQLRPLRGSERRDTENVAFSSRPFFRPFKGRWQLRVDGHDEEEDKEIITFQCLNISNVPHKSRNGKEHKMFHFFASDCALIIKELLKVTPHIALQVSSAIHKSPHPLAYYKSDA